MAAKKTIPEHPHSGIVVFLLTDIVGSTRLWEAAPQRMERDLAAHDEAVRRIIDQRGGHVFKALGDGFYASFSLPAAAIEAAIALQRHFGEAPRDADAVALHIRTLVHAGPASQRGDDFFGPSLNRAARLLNLSHGGQILVTGAAADMSRGFLPADVTLKSLGLHRMRDVREPEHVFQVLAPGHCSDFPALRSELAIEANLPPVLSDFIGREREIEEICSNIARHRLVLLVGPGGSGKTRVAIQVAQRHIRPPFDIVSFVDLSQVTDPILIAEEFCRSLGLPVRPGTAALDTAIAFLKERAALIVFDNCEQIIEHSARVIATRLGACDPLRAIPTSRERFGLPGEVVVRLGSFALPLDTAALSVEQALGFDAVALFVKRAQAIVPDFDITDANVADIVSICRQLDGLPLAIELIVPQLASLSLKQLSSRLHNRLLTVRGDRGLHGRHQSLQAVFEWSYNLLTETEQRVFRALGLFAGGWTLAAAAAVTAERDDSVDLAATLDLLTLLVEKSLVLADRSREETRYELLQPVQDYTRVLLTGEELRLGQARHAAAIAQFAEEANRDWRDAPTEAWRARCEPELENIRRALDWALGPDGERLSGLRLCANAIRIWNEFSLYAERERFVSLAFSRDVDGLEPSDLGRLWLGRLSASAQGDRTNLTPALEALSRFREANDQAGIAEALMSAGAALLEPVSIEEAMPYLDEALAILRGLPPSKTLGACLRAHGIARYFVSDFDKGRRLVQRADEVARRLRDTHGRHAAEIAAAELEFAAGNISRAIGITLELLASESTGHRHAVLARTNLAAYLLALEQVEEAELEAREALRHARSLGWRAAMARAIEHLALATALSGRHILARRLLATTVSFYAADGASREFTELASYDRLLALPAMEGAASEIDPVDVWTLEEAAEEALEPNA